MNLKEALIHRIRDFDACLHLERKPKPFAYVLLRQFSKFLGFDENQYSYLIEKNCAKLYNYTFITREKTLDFLFFSRFYEPETTKFILSMKGELFLDIGAHIGRFSVLASKRFKMVYAFEPHPSNFSLLKQNVNINNVPNVVPVNIALSDKNKISFLSKINLNTGTVKILDKGKERVRCYRLDSVMNILNLNPKNIDLIKIDVEGHEIKVLKGSNLILKKSSPLLIIEAFDKIWAIKKILSRYGYRETGILDFYNHIFVKR